MLPRFLDIARKRTVLGILILGFLNGLFYVFVVPPWEHYDEPGHFEVTWLIANRLRLPQAGETDQQMRLAVGRSLLETRFFEHRDAEAPNLTDPSQPIWIGVSQIVDPPLYYILTALPLRLLRAEPIVWQLYAGRICSLLFLLVTIYAAYKITVELTSENHPLRWMVPLFVSLLPGLVEFMTAVNNIPAAIGLASLWLLSALRLIKYKWSFKQAAILLLLTIACILTQKVVWHLAIFVPIIFLFSWVPRKKAWIAWAALFTTGLLGLLMIVDWKDAAFWLRRIDQDYAPRIAVNQDTALPYALQAKLYPDQSWGISDSSWHAGFFQLVPPDVSSLLAGQTLTLGTWIWADQPVQGYGPGLNALNPVQDRWYGFEPLSISTTPQFVATVITLPQDVGRLQIWLRATSPDPTATRIFFSGVVLVRGVLPTEFSPTLEQDGTSGSWAEQPFTNLARNSLFLRAWPTLSPEIARFLFNRGIGLNPTSISSTVALISDYPGAGWYLRSAAERIFRTFWATFCWGQVQLSPWFQHPYVGLLTLTILGIISGFIAVFKIFKPYPTEGILLLFIMLTTIAIAFLYGIYTMGGALRFRAYLPVARYIFPVILPIALILVSGWYSLVKPLADKHRLASILSASGYVLFLVFLNIYSLTSIGAYFSL